MKSLKFNAFFEIEHRIRFEFLAATVDSLFYDQYLISQKYNCDMNSQVAVDQQFYIIQVSKSIIRVMLLVKFHDKFLVYILESTEEVF